MLCVDMSYQKKSYLNSRARVAFKVELRTKFRISLTSCTIPSHCESILSVHLLRDSDCASICFWEGSLIVQRSSIALSDCPLIISVSYTIGEPRRFVSAPFSLVY